MKKYQISINGYNTWKHVKNELEMFDFYILPSIVVSQDKTFDTDKYPTEIKFAWLFWRFCIYLCI